MNILLIVLAVAAWVIPAFIALFCMILQDMKGNPFDPDYFKDMSKCENFICICICIVFGWLTAGTITVQIMKDKKRAKNKETQKEETYIYKITYKLWKFANKNEEGMDENGYKTIMSDFKESD